MNKVTRSISTVTILTFVAKMLGLVREMVIAAYYGATWQTDAYNMAISIIGLSVFVLSAGVATVIIPAYNSKLTEHGKACADSFASNILCITSIFCAILSVAGIVYAPLLISVITPSFAGEAASLTVTIVRIMFGFTIIFNASSYMISIAKLNHRFAITVVSTYPMTLFTVALTVLFSERLGIYSLVISYALFIVTQGALLILSVRKVFTFKFKVDFLNGDLRDIVRLSVPIYLSVAMGELNAMIDKTLASGLPEGSISAMGYAAKLRALPEGIITASVITVVYPLLAKYAVNKDFVSLKTLVSKIVSLLIMTLAPVVAVSLCYSREIVRIVFERGVFTAEQAELTAYIFTFAISPLMFTGTSSLLNNTFYSMKDTKTPQICAVSAVVCNIILNLILVRHMGAAGLALATSVSGVLNCALLTVLFRRKCGGLGGRKLAVNTAKSIAAAACMVPVFILCKDLLRLLPDVVAFGLGGAVSVCVYLAVLYILKMDLLREGVNRVKTSRYFFKK